MDKHAYMIIAHNQFELLKVIIEMLDDKRNDIYVHIDAKVSDFDFQYFNSLVKFSKIKFTDRISITWGDFSLLQSEMILLKSAVENEDKNNPYSYFHLISGVDLPIKTNDEIHGFFEENKGKEFVHFSSTSPDDDYSNRVKYYHLFRKKRNFIFKIFAQIALIIQRIFHVNRLKNKDISIHKGSNWFSVTNNFAKYLVSKEKEIYQLFYKTYCCDELFLQTILMNSNFKDNLYMPNCNNNQLAAARLIDWNRGNPYVFKSSDFDEIISSPAMFARKFSLEDEAVIYKIKNYVGEKFHG